MAMMLLVRAKWQSSLTRALVRQAFFWLASIPCFARAPIERMMRVYSSFKASISSGFVWRRFARRSTMWGKREKCFERNSSG